MAAHRNDKPDDLSFKILECMLSGYSNRDIANELHKPLSTVQRRTRQLIEDGFIKNKYELDHKKFGFKKGYLHVYLNDGEIYQIAEKIAKLEHVLSVSIHIGNSDIVAEYLCRDSVELLGIMALLKKIDAVEKIVWSEEVSTMPARNAILLTRSPT